MHPPFTGSGRRGDEPYRQLWLVAAVQVLAMSVWFATAAVVPSLVSVWHISRGAASWLTTAVQAGFVTGAVLSASVNLADRRRLSTLIAAAAALAGATTLFVPLLAHLLERYRDELVAAPPARFDPDAGALRAQLVVMAEAWLQHARSHPAATRLLFVPITGDPEVERVQRELHVRQRATQTALLREFAPALSDDEAEPMGEAMRSALAAMALWWIEHPDVPSEVPVSVVVRMAEGLVGATNKTDDRR